MRLTLQWTNVNTGPVTTVIYRGDAPLDRANLSNPLVTLTNQETSWIDENVLHGHTYYYVFVTTTTNDRNVSLNFPITALPRRGPGPNELQSGDYSLGYFGTIDSNAFITAGELVSKLGLTTISGGALTIANYSPTWLKYARNGKILYVPRQYLAMVGLSYGHLYNNGLVFGTDNNGPYQPNGSVARNQKRTVTIGPDTYIVRLMRGGNDPVGSFATYYGRDAPEVNGEFGDLMFPQGAMVPVSQKLPNVIKENSDSANPGFGTAITASNGILCQELTSAGQALVRGSLYNVANAHWLVYSTQRAVATDGIGGWIPVLELVES